MVLCTCGGCRKGAGLLEESLSTNASAAGAQAPKPAPPPKPLDFPAVTKNAYRIIGVNTSEARADVIGAASAVRRSLKLDVARATTWDLAWLGAVERTEATVQEALGRLGNVEQRLIERLFWFGSEAAGLAALDPTLPLPSANGTGPASQHDQSLFGLLRVAATHPTVADAAPWKDAIASWRGAVDDDSYWSSVLEAERSGGYEPAADASDIGRLRRSAVRLALLPLVAAAKTGLSGNDAALVQRVLGLLRSLGLGDELASVLETEILGPLEESLTALVREVRDGCAVVRDSAEDVSKANRPICQRATARLETEVVARLAALERLAGPTSVFSLRARGAVGELMAGLASDWTWASDFVKADKLYKRAEAQAAGTPSFGRIATQRGANAASAQSQRDKVRPITKAPKLRVGRFGTGTNIYTWGGRYPGKTDWYYGTVYFVVLMIPLIPLSRYLVTRGNGNSWGFHVRVRLGIPQWVHLGILVLLLFLL